VLLPPVSDVAGLVASFNNPVLWSLSVEFWFCILLPLLLLGKRRFGLRPFLLGAILLSIISYLPLGPIYAMNHSVYFQNVIRFIRYLPDFLIGMAVADTYVTDRSSYRKIPLLGIGIVFSIVGILLLDAKNQYQVHSLMYTLAKLIIVTGFGLTVFGALTTKSRFIRIILTNWPLRMIGMMSYSLFIWHSPAIGTLQPTLNPYRFLRYIGLVFGLSFLSYRYIEFGFVKDIRMILPRRHQKPSAREHLAIVSQ
jgi:peptidoglycan/LPS O-acetylase OafA/YrhL